MTTPVAGSTPKKTWGFTISNHADLASIILGTYVETPQPGSEVGLDKPLTLSGWAVASREPKEGLHLVVRSGGITLSYPLNRERLDVVQHLESQYPGERIPLVSGFHYDIDFELVGEQISIGFEIDGLIAEYCVITMIPG